VVQVLKDDYVRVLDYLPKGKSEVPSHKRKPLTQAIGENYFSLLEITPREGASFEMGDRVYIGEGVRDKVDHIERRIKYDWLTPTAKAELPQVLKSIVSSDEKRFVEFYNTAGIISTRQHKLEILPKIGKRHRDEILEERRIKPFGSFKDMEERLKSIPDPAKIIVEKIIEEIKGDSKYMLFVPISQETRHEFR
jgi:putative nucleotide binding protein